MRRRNLALIVTLLLALASACTDPALGGKLFVCEDDSDCGDEWRCVYSATLGESVCRPEGYQEDALADAVVPDGTAGDTTLPDAGGDAGTDAGGPGDTLGDVAGDVTPDAGPDAVPDAVPDTFPDAGPDVTPDATPDADAGPDACDPASCPAETNPSLQACREPACDVLGCTLAIKAGYCVIEGACVADGEPGPTCMVCDAANDPQGWTVAPASTPCDDGDPCTGEGSCEGGECQKGPPDACDDGNPCTEDLCGPGGACSHDPVAGKCDDGNPCTTGDSCVAGTCQGGAADGCNDGDACTTDSCEDGTGCEYDAVTCDDGNACTTDTCDKATGCVFTAIVCNDDDACTNDVCSAGACSFLVKNCNDGLPCTFDECSPIKGGCIHTPKDADCDDGNPCLDWSCDASEGCVSAPLSGDPCDDGDACTPADVCMAGTCDLMAFQPPTGLSVKEDLDPSSPRIAVAPGGTWIAVWQNGGVEGAPTPPGGGDPLSDVIVARSTTDGDALQVTGPLETGGPGNPHDSRAPSVATDGAGTWVVAFTRRDGSPGSKPTTYVSVSKDDGASFGTPSAVGKASSGTAGEDSWPAVAYDAASGAFVVVWSSTVKTGGSNGDMDLLVSRSIDGGAQWSSPVVLGAGMASDIAADRFSSRALAAGGGRLVVAWDREDKHGSFDEADVWTAWSLDGGVTWVASAVEPNAGQPQEAELELAPALATDGQGNWMLVYSSAQTGVSGPGDSSLRVKVSTTGASWESATSPSNPAAGDPPGSQPSVATDGAGAWLMAWVTHDPDSGLGDDLDTVWAISLDRGASWSLPRAVVAEAYGDTTDDQTPFVLARAGDGFAVALTDNGAEQGATTRLSLWKEAPHCADGNVCTADSCGPGGCKQAAQVAACDDGDACTKGDACSGGACKGTGTVTCEDSNPCTTDACEADGGCTNTPAAGPCDDGDACTTGESCAGGACAGGVLPDCDDGDPCTSDGCDSAVGCVHTLLAIACDDGDPCTVDDQCGGGACAGTPTDCEDGNLCTVDTCNTAGDCEHSDLGCDDGNPCTSDNCDDIEGCSYVMLNDIACDGDPCVVNECFDGTCTPLVPPPSVVAKGLLNDWAPSDITSKDTGLTVATGVTVMLAVVSSELDTLGLGADSDVVSMSSKDGGETWEAFQPLWSGAVSDSGTDLEPSIAAGPQDEFLAVWVSRSEIAAGSGTDKDVFSARWNLKTSNWTDVQVVGDYMKGDTVADDSPVVASTGSGTWMAIWSSSSDPLHLGLLDRDLWIAHYADGGWGAAARLDETVADSWDDAGGPRSLAGDGAGTFVYVWPRVGTTSGAAQIVAARSGDAGQKWDAAKIISDAAGSSAAVTGGLDVATDGAGTWMAVWTAEGTGGGNDQDVLYAKSTDDGVTWSAPAVAAAWMTTDVATDTAPDILFAPEGAWVIAWETTYDGSDLGADRDTVLVVSRDGGATWTEPVPLNASATTDNALAYSEGAPVLAWSNRGGVVAAWTTDFDGVVDDVDDDYRYGRWTPTYMPCADGDLTTSDVCDPDSAATCAHVPVPVSCEDGDPCTDDPLGTVNSGLVCDHVNIDGCP